MILKYLSNIRSNRIQNQLKKSIRNLRGILFDIVVIVNGEKFSFRNSPKLIWELKRKRNNFKEKQ